MKNKKIMKEILKTYGIDKQKRKFAEELYELQEAIVQYEDGKGNFEHLIEEFGDVYTVFQILLLHYNISLKDIKQIGKQKLIRQNNRMHH